MRNALFNEVSHELPIGGLISRSLPFRKVNLPICDENLSWLGGVKLFDDIMIFLFESTDDLVDFERPLKIFLALTAADHSGRLDRILDRIYQIGLQGFS